MNNLQYIDTTYDEFSKNLLHSRKVLGMFLTKLIPEFRNVQPKLLARWIRKDPDDHTKAFNLYDSISYFDDLDKVVPKGSKRNRKIKKNIKPDTVIQINIPKQYRKRLGYHDGKSTDYIIFNLEMQRRNTNDLLYRAELYTSILSSATLNTKDAPKLKPYNQVRKVFSIWLCKENLFTRDTNVKTNLWINDKEKVIQTKDMFIHNFRMAEYYSYRNEKTGTIEQKPFYNPNMHSKDIIFIELEKIFKKAKVNEGIFQDVEDILKAMFDTMSENNNYLQTLIEIGKETYQEDMKEEAYNMMGIAGTLLAEKDKIVAEKDALSQQNNTLSKEKDKAVAEKDKAVAEKDKAVAVADKAVAVADKALTEFVRYMMMYKETDDTIAERTGLSLEQINQIKTEMN